MGMRASGGVRVRAGAILAAALAGATTVLSASAVPAAATPVSAMPAPVSSNDLAVDALFASGAQVYQRVAVRPAGTYPPSNEVVLRRVHERGGIEEGAALFAYAGVPLPEAFSFAETFPASGEGWGVVTAVDPATLQDLPIAGRPSAVYFYTGPAGPVAGAGIATPYYG